ncbi:homeodomain super [Ciborinia camelliae]|nr:homeodomain super [Ciborinia camelliae]
MAASQSPRGHPAREWRAIELLRSAPRLPDVPTLPSIRTILSGLESHEGPTEQEYRHNSRSFSPAREETTYNTSPGSNKRRRPTSDYCDQVFRRNTFRYGQMDPHELAERSSQSPMIETWYDSRDASPTSSSARRESLRSVPESKAYSSRESPHMSGVQQEQSILSIPERRATYQDQASRPSFHSPIPEPPSYHPNLSNLTTSDPSYDRSYSQPPVASPHSDYPPRSDYPRHDYSRSDYPPRNDYPRHDYSRSDYPPRNDYPIHDYPRSDYPPGNDYPRKDYLRSEYALEGSRSYNQNNYATSHDTSHASSQSNYGYQQPRNQPYSVPYQLSQGPTPFTNAHHSGNYSPATHQTQDMEDSKPRKRRGNLPKPTTDILNAWFSSHLDHPYPNEEVKQLLMRQTGLQLNQISNWFINARRRKLPQLQKSARAEHAARSHQNQMHSPDGAMAPQSLYNNDAETIPPTAAGLNDSWHSHQQEETPYQQPF